MYVAANIIAEVRAANIEKELAKRMEFESSFNKYIISQFKASGLYRLPAACGFLQDTKNNFGDTPTRLTIGNKNIQIFPIYTQSSESYFVCFDMNRIQKGDFVKLYVPSGKEGIFIGKGGKHIKSWCRQLELMGISVVGY